MDCCILENTEVTHRGSESTLDCKTCGKVVARYADRAARFPEKSEFIGGREMVKIDG